MPEQMNNYNSIVNQNNIHSRDEKLTSSYRSLGGGGSSPDSLLNSLHSSPSSYIKYFLDKIPAAFLVCLLNFMISIPFGVSYFPVEWKAEGENSSSSSSSEEAIIMDGIFPVEGKEALGIRMFLFSTIIGQLVFGFTSGFDNAVGMQMVENIPFCHSLAYIVIQEQGYGIDALSTLFFLFGLSSVLVGIVFYILGFLQIGRMVYYFPSFLLLGCIGGIGFFVLKVGLEVTMNTDITFDYNGLESIIEGFHLIRVVLFFEITLRLLIRLTKDEEGKQKYTLLCPMFYFFITPIFYLGCWIVGYSIENAHEDGYFFPQIGGGETVATTKTVLDTFEDMFKILGFVHWDTICWRAVMKSIPTMISLIAFSLIHVPINIPAFSISTGVDADMDKELIAHGYSNAISGIFAGLQNYLCYANSVLYAECEGHGIFSSFLIVMFTLLLYFIGPTIAMYLPRAMAGTLLLHIGVDLFLEGVYDSYGKYDRVEYTGIWAITTIMSMFGMSAGIITGVISALSVYAFQSITYVNPVRGAMCAKTLRSSRWNRQKKALMILDDPIQGRGNIFVIQLQGHIFFGNVTQLKERVIQLLSDHSSHNTLIVILDFSLVVGMDSSAAHQITKLKEMIHRKYDVSLALFVTGNSAGFPCEYNLSNDLAKPFAWLLSSTPHRNMTRRSSSLLGQRQQNQSSYDSMSISQQSRNDFRSSCHSSFSRIPSSLTGMGESQMPEIPADYVCESLDGALIVAEDALIALIDPSLLESDSRNKKSYLDLGHIEEHDLALYHLSNLCSDEPQYLIRKLLSHMVSVTWSKENVIWRQGSKSNALHLLVQGRVLSVLEDEAGTTEVVNPGAMFGELGLVNDMDRLSTVECLSERAVTYCLSREVWETKVKNDPDLSRCIYMITVRYLAHRVQHVSNRIFETRCVPI